MQKLYYYFYFQLRDYLILIVRNIIIINFKLYICTIFA